MDGPTPRERCDNCDRDDDELIVVHRLYVVPESWDTAGSVTKVDETERWCFSCRSMYPHELV
ncbi:MAG TPA: hypothetical protein VFH45_01140 [Acidimicrobiales bacterium]|nr:hypothetical protein [Acidimicrobiales bacterium]